MARGETSSLGDALSDYFARQGIKRRIAEAGVVNDWATLVGSQLAQISEPISVDKKGVLWVRVTSAAWIQELRLMSPTILKSLAERGRFIREIRWAAGDGTSGPSTEPTR